MKRRTVRTLTSSHDARALEDAADRQRRTAALLQKIQDRGDLTDVDPPELPRGTDWLADRARARRGQPGPTELAELRADIERRAAMMRGELPER